MEDKGAAYWLRLIVETNDERWRQEGKSLLNETFGVKEDIFFDPHEIRIVSVIDY
jgi:hypothetical protein